MKDIATINIILFELNLLPPLLRQGCEIRVLKKPRGMKKKDGIFFDVLIYLCIKISFIVVIKSLEIKIFIYDLL